MTIYEYNDGTVIRYKPLGDKIRKGPSYSVEVKKDILQPDTGFDSIAFKVDKKGNPLPKWQKEINRPFPLEQKNKYINFLLDDDIMGQVNKVLR